MHSCTIHFLKACFPNAPCLNIILKNGLQKRDFIFLSEYPQDLNTTLWQWEDNASCSNALLLLSLPIHFRVSWRAINAVVYNRPINHTTASSCYHRPRLIPERLFHHFRFAFSYESDPLVYFKHSSTLFSGLYTAAAPASGCLSHASFYSTFQTEMIFKKLTEPSCCIQSRLHPSTVLAFKNLPKSLRLFHVQQLNNVFPNSTADPEIEKCDASTSWIIQLPWHNYLNSSLYDLLKQCSFNKLTGLLPSSLNQCVPQLWNLCIVRQKRRATSNLICI